MRSYLHIITIIILNFTAGYGARVHVLYKPTGGKAHLTLREPWNVTAVRWRKDHELIATVENKESGTRDPEKYHIRASDSSLFIRNLSLNDSGVYKAQTGHWEELEIQYTLIVQEAVSVPVIDVRPVHRSNSSSSVCDFSVKCSADGDSATYDCERSHCTRTNATSTRVNITVNYTDTGLFECTASNRVSTERASIHAANTCSEKPSASAASPTTTWVAISTCCTVFIVLIIVCIVTIHYNVRKKEQTIEPYQQDKSVNTVYSVVCKQPRGETPAESSAAQNAATSVYDVPSICGGVAKCDSVQKEGTDTVYWKLGQTHEA